MNLKGILRDRLNTPHSLIEVPSTISDNKSPHQHTRGEHKREIDETCADGKAHVEKNAHKNAQQQINAQSKMIS